MSGKFLLDWAIMAVSLFNTILLLWLGLTVLLNADRRTWGIWLAGGGLLMGGAFFVSHSAILGRGLHHISPGMEFWWRVGWVPVVALPLAWYLVMLWYAGFWNDRSSALRQRQRPWLIVIILLVLGLVGLLALANPLPSYWQMANLDFSTTPSVGGMPVLILAYPLYIVLCIVLALDVLRHPGPSMRVMGDQARRRARPWLVAASITLLLVSVLVALVMLWIVANGRQRALYDFYASMAVTVAWFDLVIASLIALSVVLLGQAVVSYEIFTGKALPRGGLIGHWRRAVILAAGYGVVVGWSLSVQLRAVYGLLLTALLMTFFYALLSWRSYAERERYIEQLRPFVASQRLYDHLLTTPLAPTDIDVRGLFQALCSDVLGVRLAYLVPLGPSTPLVGSGLAFPPNALPPPLRPEVVARFRSPQTVYTPLDPATYKGAMWAVPLWSERGLIGALLLGEKRDGGLYTQEEIEIARASGERLMDTLASSEMARRLMALQRQRLAESRLLDQKTRRALHDDILPLLHAAMLNLSNGSGEPGTATADAIELLTDAHRQLSALLREMPSSAASEIARLGLIGALRRSLDDELAEAFDGVTWQVDPEAEQAVGTIPPLANEVLFYATREAFRNAARHGRDEKEDGQLHLRVAVSLHPPALGHRGGATGGGTARGALEIIVKDDGVGFGEEGAPTSHSGQGLALHSTLMAVVGGTLSVDSLPGAHTRVSLSLPLDVWPVAEAG